VRQELNYSQSAVAANSILLIHPAFTVASSLPASSLHLAARFASSHSSLFCIFFAYHFLVAFRFSQTLKLETYHW